MKLFFENSPAFNLIKFVINRCKHEPTTDPDRTFDKHPIHDILKLNYKRTDTVTNEDVEVYIVVFFGQKVL